MTLRLGVVSLHTSPLTQPGQGDSGGMNVYVRELAGALARRGVDVDVYVRADADTGIGEVRVEPGLRVVHLPVGPPGLPKEQLPGIVEEFTECLAAELSERPVDVLHANYWLSAVAAHELKHRLAVPLAVTFHTLGEVKRRTGDDESDARIESERTVVGCADAILANASPERDQLVSLYGAASDRIQIVSPGVDRALFSPGPARGARAALGLGDDPRLLFVGRIQPLKGLDLAIEALARSAHPNARLSVVGGPSGAGGRAHMVDLVALAERLGVDDRIDWHPPQPHHLLSTWYRAADVVVMPSRSESFGLVALEAGACGRPVVATAVGGLRHLITEGHNGHLVNGRDPSALAAAVDRVIADPDHAARLGRGGSEVADQHTWASAAARLEGLVTELTSRALVPCG